MKKQYQQTVEEKERKMREYFESGIKIRLGIDRTNEHLEDMKPAGKLIGKRQKRQNSSIDGMCLPGTMVKFDMETTSAIISKTSIFSLI